MIKCQAVSDRQLIQTFEKNHASLATEIDALHSVLHVFCHEGRAQFGKNMRRLDDAIRSLEVRLGFVSAYEEKCLFPFISVHIPRFEPLITLLGSEHEDFRRLLKGLGRSLSAFKQEKEASLQLRSVQRIREEGMYLICLMRSHLWAETRNMYEALNRELRAEEKENLARRLQEFSLS